MKTTNLFTTTTTARIITITITTITITITTITMGLFNNRVTLSSLYAKFRWLISHVQLSFQPRKLIYSAD